jgi:AraC family transcriptional regulator of adaptative response / DNA-3-methyladenine glycosylase II
MDADSCYRAVASRDARFDGWFVTAVRTTGIYCRPSCPAVTPKRRNVAFYPTSAAAQSAGFRACRRCLPDAVPGSPEWNVRADLAGRAMRLIADGVVERDGVPGLASRLGYSPRQLGRVLTAELGAGPLALARAHRAHAARLLVQRTDLAMADVAFAAGFTSVRQFNDTMLAVFAVPPSRLRAEAMRGQPRLAPALVPVQAGTIALRLPFRRPMDGVGLLRFLSARAVPGVEAAVDGRYARTLELPHGPATVSLRVDQSYVDTMLRLADLRDLVAAVARVRRLLDLDADPVGVDEVLRTDPALAPTTRDTPGIRVPGSVDGAETAIRAVLGQQVSVAAARTAAWRLAEALGSPLPSAFVPDEPLRRLFPKSEAIAEHAADVLRGPRRRIETVSAVAAALASGDIDVHPGRDTPGLRADLEALPGVGAWTADYIAMRVLGAPDVLLSTDRAVRRGAAALSLPSTVEQLERYSKRWQPWRSYAVMHLWRVAASQTSSEVRRTA